MLVSSKFELIELDNFTKKLDKKLKISTKDKEKLSKRIAELEDNPYHGTRLKDLILISGIKIAGLRHEKYGVANYKGGLAVLYRICEECLAYKYYDKGSGKKCALCDEEKPKRVFLFDIRPRGEDY